MILVERYFCSGCGWGCFSVSPLWKCSGLWWPYCAPGCYCRFTQFRKFNWGQLCGVWGHWRSTWVTRKSRIWTDRSWIEYNCSKRGLTWLSIFISFGRMNFDLLKNGFFHICLSNFSNLISKVIFRSKSLLYIFIGKCFSFNILFWC